MTDESLLDDLEFSSGGAEVDLERVQKISNSWLKNAGIREFQELLAAEKGEFNPDISDYSFQFLPVSKHASFQRLSQIRQNEVATCAWLSMNTRIITIEDKIVRPALDIITQPHMPGAEDIAMIARQTQIDEEYHSLFHMDAIQRTRKNRKYDKKWDVPVPITFVRMLELQQKYNQSWQKQLTNVAFAVVAEVSFTPFLAELAQEDIQPFNRKILNVHAKDEARHGQTLAECCRALHQGMGYKEKEFFYFIMPKAINAFLEEDWNGWQATLNHLKIPDSNSIIQDIRSQDEEDPDLIMSEFKPIKRLFEEMDIVDKIEFNFNPGLKPL